MKTVRTVNGVSRIDYALTGKELYHEKVVEILNAHRDTLIKRLLSNLEIYLIYKFNLKVDKDKLNRIKDELSSLKDHNVNDAHSVTLLTALSSRDNIYVDSLPFYEEIDEAIRWCLK